MPVYTLGINGFARRHVLDALGAPSHVRQASILVSAPSKAAAARELERCYVGHGDATRIARDAEFRQAGGRYVDTLAAAGVFDQVIVVAMPLTPVGESWPVVAVDGPDTARLLGRITRAGGFIPTEARP